MYNNPRPIAILLATYNSSRYLHEQLDSLLAQTYQDWTVYVRDDSSSDDTVEILREYHERDPRFVILQDDKGNLGPKANFIQLLSTVESDYYMFMDADDYWLQAKIEKEMALMKQIEGDGSHPALVFTNLKLADGDLNILSDSFWREIRFSPTLFNNVRDHAYISFITGCTMLFNRAAREVSLPVADYSPMHDWWVAQCVYRNQGVVEGIEEPLMLYRKHGGNATGDFISTQHGKSVLTRIAEMRRQYHFLRRCGTVSNPIDYLQLKYHIKHQQHLLTST